MYRSRLAAYSRRFNSLMVSSASARRYSFSLAWAESRTISARKSATKRLYSFINSIKRVAGSMYFNMRNQAKRSSPQHG